MACTVASMIYYKIKQTLNREVSKNNNKHLSFGVMEKYPKKNEKKVFKSLVRLYLHLLTKIYKFSPKSNF